MNKIMILCLTIIFLLSSFSVGAVKINKNISLISKNSEEFDMVIISPNIFSSDLQQLIDHKNSRGINTYLKTTEDIYLESLGRDKPEQIKYYIKNSIESFSIKYVLLVGGADLLPGRYTHIYFEYYYQVEWVFLSDLYYADIYDSSNNFCSWDSNGNNVFAEYKWYGNNDDLDLVPDVYLGRLPCVNSHELNIVIDKIITYENNDAYISNWFKNLILIGGDSLLGDKEKIDEGEYVNQQVMEIMDGFNFETVWASNQKLYQSSNINNAINKGAGFVFFNGHGNLRTWATHPHENNKWIPDDGYYNSNLIGLKNGDKLPIVVSDACFHCTYNQASDCFGWTFITNPNGGAIAFLGGTDIDVSYGGVDIITKGVERLCLLMSTNYMQGKSLTFGELWGQGITSYLPNDNDEIDHITVMEFQPFGDPSLKIGEASNPPDKPQRPNGPANGKTEEEYTYTSSTIEPDGEQIFFKFDWDDGTDSGWLGPYNSNDIVSASHKWTNNGNYEIKVIAKDENGTLSEWSDSLSVSMPRNRYSSGTIKLLITSLIKNHLTKFL